MAQIILAQAQRGLNQGLILHARVVLLQDTITRAQLLRAVQDGAWFAFLAYSGQNKACDGTVDTSGV